jgi:hypothetical protein
MAVDTHGPPTQISHFLHTAFQAGAHQQADRRAIFHRGQAHQPWPIEVLVHGGAQAKHAKLRIARQDLTDGNAPAARELQAQCQALSAVGPDANGQFGDGRDRAARAGRGQDHWGGVQRHARPQSTKRTPRRPLLQGIVCDPSHPSQTCFCSRSLSPAFLERQYKARAPWPQIPTRALAGRPTMRFLSWGRPGFDAGTDAGQGMSRARHLVNPSGKNQLQTIKRSPSPLNTGELHTSRPMGWV